MSIDGTIINPVKDVRKTDWKGTTPARIGVGRAGCRPLTREVLNFRADHAAAADTVFRDVDLEWIASMGFLTVDTLAADRAAYLRGPDLGRRLSPEAVRTVAARCTTQPQVQILVSNGLSSDAVSANLASAYKALRQSIAQKGLTAGTPLYISNGRVGVMDHVGEILHAAAAVLLIGERPGLSAADSMSAYLCYRPNFKTVDSDRMVVSNIHRRGRSPEDAGAHLGGLLQTMIFRKASGISGEDICYSKN